MKMLSLLVLLLGATSVLADGGSVQCGDCGTCDCSPLADALAHSRYIIEEKLGDIRDSLRPRRPSRKNDDDDEPCPHGYADTLYKGGYIYTVDPEKSVAEALVIKDGQIACVGSHAKCSRCAGPSTHIEHLNGAMVLPGFAETHDHSIAFSSDVASSIQGTSLPLFDVAGSVAATSAALEAFVRDNDFEVYFASGYSRTQYNVELGLEAPTKFDLDAIATAANRTGAAIAVFEVNGHSIWVSSGMLARLGITAATVNIANGVVERLPNSSEPSGQLLENYVEVVFGEAMPLSLDLLKAVFSEVLHYEFTARGVTALFDATTGFASVDVQRSLIGAAFEAMREQEVPLRFRSAWFINPASPSGDSVTEQLQKVAQFADELDADDDYEARDAKFFIDGILEGPVLIQPGTAFLLQPYTNYPDTFGTSFWNNPTLDPAKTLPLRDAYALATSLGFSMHSHTIGDGAVRFATDEHVAAALPASARHSLGHLQLSDVADLRRMADAGIGASVTGQWAIVDEFFALFYVPSLGFSRAYHDMYSYASMISSGVSLAFGSDFPISNPDAREHAFTALSRTLSQPFYDYFYGGFEEYFPYSRDADTRYTPENVSSFEVFPVGPLRSNQERAELDDVVEALTLGGARQLGIDDVTGSLEVGKSADLVVFDANWFTAYARFRASNSLDDLEPIIASTLLKTVFKGRVVYDSAAAAATPTASSGATSYREQIVSTLTSMRAQRHSRRGAK